jgi:hypothetical protein
MDTDQPLLSDTSILDSSIDSVDSVVLHQRERNKLLEAMALNAQTTEVPIGTGANKTPLGSPLQLSTSTSPTNQLNQSSVDEITETLDQVSLNTLNKGFQVIEPSKPRYLSLDIVQHFNELNMARQRDLNEMLKKCALCSNM